MRTILERRLAARGEEKLDEGFTLIELLVVLLILGILIAIAIPTFMNITKSASKTAAESNLQTALTGADAFYQSNSESYTGLMSGTSTASSIVEQQTGLDYVSGGGSTNAHIIGIESLNSGSALIMTAASTTNSECYAIVDLKQPFTVAGISSSASAAGTYFLAATGVPASQDATKCLPSAVTGTTVTWKSSTAAFPA